MNHDDHPVDNNAIPGSWFQYQQNNHMHHYNEMFSVVVPACCDTFEDECGNVLYKLAIFVGSAEANSGGESIEDDSWLK
ncbi:hypothetical protein DERF_009947 [Dermatophagoides farinae]|uniref:Uncharacterized protein n=1 Tax=Dermatophagoides farinae TaxID=6954 RepID=A0A922HYA6_DERFA|nr:hypothetical protein DERF_009947 [Dermatophagoides farinae]